MEDFDFPMYGDSWWKVDSVLQTPPVHSAEASETALTRLACCGPTAPAMGGRSIGIGIVEDPGVVCLNEESFV